MSVAYASRYESVFLCMNPRGPKITFSAAAHYMKKSKDFVTKWVNRYKEIGNVDDFPERGKKRSTTKREDNWIIKLFMENPTYSLRQAQKVLTKKGINVSLRTIKRRLEASGYR